MSIFRLNYYKFSNLVKVKKYTHSNPCTRYKKYHFDNKGKYHFVSISYIHHKNSIDRCTNVVYNFTNYSIPIGNIAKEKLFIYFYMNYVIISVTKGPPNSCRTPIIKAHFIKVIAFDRVGFFGLYPLF